MPSPSMAKNNIKRSLAEICDPPPSKSEKARLWAYFDSCCAYCGIHLDRKSRTAHLDHLLSISEGGNNSIFNRALSCARCNGDEKREMAWQEFLLKKSGNQKEFEVRKLKIAKWLALAPSQSRPPSFDSEVKQIIEQALEDFNRSVKKMRALRDKNRD